MKWTVDDLRSRLPLPATTKWKYGVWDIEAIKAGGVSLVFFAPELEDLQTSHEQEKFYFNARGTAELLVEAETHVAAAGDAFFVPAGREHHFKNFSHDFATWAVFF